MEDEQQRFAACHCNCVCVCEMVESSSSLASVIVDKGGGVVEEGKDKRAQSHAIGPVTSIGARVVEEVAIPAWDGGCEERRGEEADHETRRVECDGEVFAKHASSGSRGLFWHGIGGGVGCNGNAFFREHLCVVGCGSVLCCDG